MGTSVRSDGPEVVSAGELSARQSTAPDATRQRPPADLHRPEFLTTPAAFNPVPVLNTNPKNPGPRGRGHNRIVFISCVRLSRKSSSSYARSHSASLWQSGSYEIQTGDETRWLSMISPPSLCPKFRRSSNNSSHSPSTSGLPPPLFSGQCAKNDSQYVLTHRHFLD